MGKCAEADREKRKSVQHKLRTNPGRGISGKKIERDLDSGEKPGGKCDQNGCRIPMEELIEKGVIRGRKPMNGGETENNRGIKDRLLDEERGRGIVREGPN